MFEVYGWPLRTPQYLEMLGWTVWKEVRSTGHANENIIEPSKTTEKFCQFRGPIG